MELETEVGSNAGLQRKPRGWKLKAGHKKGHNAPQIRRKLLRERTSRTEAAGCQEEVRPRRMGRRSEGPAFLPDRLGPHVGGI